MNWGLIFVRVFIKISLFQYSLTAASIEMNLMKNSVLDPKIWTKETRYILIAVYEEFYLSI